MSDLLTNVLEAAGGEKRWSEITKIRAELILCGRYWGWKGWPEGQSGLEHIVFTADTRKQHASVEVSAPAGERWVLDQAVPVLRIENQAGEVIESRESPRDSYAGHQLETPWDRIHLGYFITYALWTYFTSPFLFTYPGLQTEEIEPWEEDGETWRRLLVTYPTSVATHSTESVFYYDEKFRQRRFDYAPYVASNVAVTHYTDDMQIYDGIVYPAKRIVYLRDPDTDRRIPGGHIITADTLSVELS
jgi:hypothetical protein